MKNVNIVGHIMFAIHFRVISHDIVLIFCLVFLYFQMLLKKNENNNNNNNNIYSHLSHLLTHNFEKHRHFTGNVYKEGFARRLTIKK